MSGVFGIASKDDCVDDLFYGTDYHSHLGTMRAGLAVKNSKGITRFIHDITNHPFRSKFEHDITKMKGTKGIGVISDSENQPLVVSSHLGKFAIVSVSKINNVKELASELFTKRRGYFSELLGEDINPTELVAALINEGSDFVDGIKIAQNAIAGSCSLLLLTDEGIFAARDKLGRTPLIIGAKQNSYAITLETCAFPNLNFQPVKCLGSGEILYVTENGFRQVAPPGDEMRICSFLWIYYGFPASSYENINVEIVRYRCGAALAKADAIQPDIVAGIPDSGTGHGLGYAAEKRIPFMRPFTKYTPTWPRSFMPPDEDTRKLVARMKLIPIRDIIHGKRILFCEDSIVRGTQLGDTIQRLFDCGAKEVHMRPACPPLVYGCPFLNFSRSKSELDLAARKAIHEMEDESMPLDFAGYTDPDSDKHREMVERIRRKLRLTTLQYQKLPDMIEAIGLPKEKLCTFCWDGIDL